MVKWRTGTLGKGLGAFSFLGMAGFLGRGDGDSGGLGEDAFGGGSWLALLCRCGGGALLTRCEQFV
jgi:hypothetical protein